MFEVSIVIVVGLCFFLMHRLRVTFSLGRLAVLVLSVVVVGLVAPAIVSLEAGDSFNVSAWRIPATIGYIAVAYLPYLAFGLIPIWVVDVIWRRASARAERSVDAAVGHSQGFVEVTSAELTATPVDGPSAVPSEGDEGQGGHGLSAGNSSLAGDFSAGIDAPSLAGDLSAVASEPSSEGQTLRPSTAGSHKPLSPRMKTIRTLTVAAIVTSAAFVGYGYVRATVPDITHVDFAHTEIPTAFDGYRIVLVTDLHIGPTRSGEWLQARVGEINALDADLVLIVGDLVDGFPEQIGDEMLPILDIYARDGVYITTGNHEYYTSGQAWVDFWESHGMAVLTNKAVVITRDGQSIDLVGINDRTGRPPLAADVAEAIATLPSAANDTSRFRVLAAHQPVQALAGDNLASQLGIDLQLSGHTHGGQVWPVHFLAELQQGVLDGVHELGGVTVVTSRGVGAWGPPVRIGAPPEIVVVQLHAT